MKRRLGDGREVLILEPRELLRRLRHTGPAAAGSPRALPRRFRAGGRIGGWFRHANDLAEVQLK